MIKPQNLFLDSQKILLLLISLTLIVWYKTVISFYQLWSNDDNTTYSHGILLFFVCGFIFVKQWRDKKDLIRFDINYHGLVLLAITTVVWLLASLGNIQVIQQLSLVFSLLFIVLSLLGFAGCKIFSFPILLMLCAIPIWDFFVPFLRLIAVTCVTYLLNITGYLSVSEGFNIMIPAGIFSVDVGCSGLNQFVVASIVGLLYAYTNNLTLISSITVVALALFFSVLSNILRIYIVVVSGQHTDMQHYFVTEDHIMLGWFVFAVLMFCYLLLINRISRLKSVQNSKFPATSTVENTRPHKVITVVATIMIIILSSFFILRLVEPSKQILPVEIVIPEKLGMWELSHKSIKSWQPAIKGADHEKHVDFRYGEQTISAHIYYYYYQEQDKEAVNDINDLTGMSWTKGESKRRIIENGANQYSVRQTETYSSHGRRKLIWNWYEINGKVVSEPMLAKMMNIWGIITGSPAIIHYVIGIDIKQDSAVAESKLKDLLLNLYKRA